MLSRHCTNNRNKTDGVPIANASSSNSVLSLWGRSMLSRSTTTTTTNLTTTTATTRRTQGTPAATIPCSVVLPSMMKYSARPKDAIDSSPSPNRLQSRKNQTDFKLVKFLKEKDQCSVFDLTILRKS